MTEVAILSLLETVLLLKRIQLTFYDIDSSLALPCQLDEPLIVLLIARGVSEELGQAGHDRCYRPLREV